MALGQRQIPCGCRGRSVVSREPEQRVRLDVAGRDRMCGLSHIIGCLLSTSAVRCIAWGIDL